VNLVFGANIRMYLHAEQNWAREVQPNAGLLLICRFKWLPAPPLPIRRNVTQPREGKMIGHEQRPLSGRLLKNPIARHDNLSGVEVKDRNPVRILDVFGVIEQVADELESIIAGGDIDNGVTRRVAGRGLYLLNISWSDFRSLCYTFAME
jgi:hypothetical protein